MPREILGTRATGTSALLCTPFITPHSRNNTTYWQLDRKIWVTVFWGPTEGLLLYPMFLNSQVFKRNNASLSEQLFIPLRYHT
jgi:hypothetical protein